MDQLHLRDERTTNMGVSHDHSSKEGSCKLTSLDFNLSSATEKLIIFKITV